MSKVRGKAGLTKMTGSLAGLLALVACSFSVAAAAADPAPPAAEVFFRRPSLTGPQLSPSGKRLAFKFTGAEGRVTLVMLDLDEGNKIHSAGVKDADVTRFQWVGDDLLVFSSEDLKALGRDRQHLAPGLFSVSADGAQYHRLVRVSGGPLAGTSRLGEDPLTWNHELLLVPQPQPGVVPDEVVLGELVIHHDEVDHVVPKWLNARTGEHRPMDLGQVPDHALEWWFDSAGHPRAIYTQSDGRGAYYWRGPQDKAWRLLAQSSAMELPFAIRSVDDAGQLYVTESRGDDGVQVLTHFDFSRDAPAERALVQVPGFDFDGELLQQTAGARALGVRVDADAETTVWFDPAMRKFQLEVDARLPGHINRIECRRCGQPDMVATVLSFSDRDPGTLWLYRASEKRWTPVQSVMQGIEPRHMAKVDFQRIKARDGRDLPVWLTLPPGVEPGQPAPTVVMVHGGPWERIGHWRWDAMNQFLASRGYLVIEPEFRGSDGYGDSHLRAGFKQWGQAMEDDLSDALHWAQDRGLAAKGRACIAGASYGGYAALMGPVRQPEDWACVVAWSAVTDLDLFLDGSWSVRDDIGAGSRKYGYPEMVGDIRKDAAMLAANSPVLLARKIRLPVLLAYGDQDMRTPIRHGKRMRDALTSAGNPPQWLVYENEGHGFSNPRNETDYAHHVEAFLAQHLK